ncbi:MAG: alpha/beta hydrolase [Candidatus Woesearchaeota archaeon]
MIGFRDISELASLLSYWLNPVDSKSPDTITLHGYVDSGRSMNALGHHLTQTGRVVRNLNYPFQQDLKKTACTLSEDVKRIVDEIAKPIDIVTHSMGGVVAIEMAQKIPTYFGKVVLLGVPYRGTWVAAMNNAIPLLNRLTPSSGQMTPCSKYLAELAEGGFPEDVSFFSVYSTDDKIIPVDSSRLPERANTYNIEISGVGHWGLIGPKNYSLVRKILE